MPDIRVFFVTNRNHLPDNKEAVFGAQFNPDGVAALRFGYADYGVGGGKPAFQSVFVYPEAKADAPAEGFARQGSAGFLDDLRAAMGDERSDTLVFIHGFNVTFVEALHAGARLGHQVTIEKRRLNVVVFSWPADGKAIPWMSYYSDREDARSSGAAIARAYLKLHDFVCGLKPDDYCNRNLHLLAHSMGNYVLRQGLQALLSKEPRRLVRLFDEIVLAAPDEDDDAFETDGKLRLLPQIARRITLYHNSRDRALLVSDKTKANPDRLGSDGPRMLDLLPRKIVVVDCRRVVPAKGDSDIAYHSYFLTCPPVSTDLTATLAGAESGLIGNREVVRPDLVYRIMG
ncbi:alpha/beta fold hydrolase [Sphingosinicella sp. LHD-64]|uniref:alpha/beta hydrolase n=1 Tax=Sphingosinicella sp. LHD-64 TaxID=3072139 RepID=UPI00280F7C18|nr:alpha/beta fold hydrolase [Sphingosinicella sp. LHD-64]MDQ8757815.1 alpha/beta fold hydrolase [Sphingosinicella sp. LHD-64]